MNIACRGRSLFVVFCLQRFYAVFPFPFESCRSRIERRCSLHNSRRHDDSISRSAFLAACIMTLPVATHAASANHTESTSLPHIRSPFQQTFQESISGVFAGSALTVTKTLVKYPLDTVAVRLQMPPSSGYSLSEPLQLFRNSYRGIWTPLITNIPAGAVFFGVKDACKPLLTKSSLGLLLPPWAITMIAVAVAQPPYWAVRNPSEVVKTRQQANVTGFTDDVSVFESYKRVMEETGNSNESNRGGFYTGYVENILYAYPADVLKFVVYESIVSDGYRKQNSSPAEGAMAGALSTAIAQFVTTPLDVVRNRVMANVIDRANKDDTISDSSYLETLVQLAQREGFAGLFAGAGPRVAKAMVSGAIQFATYEQTKQRITDFFAAKEHAKHLSQ
jgi:solute carrier family 25 S-adenosylmethionine transporter 26